MVAVIGSAGIRVTHITDQLAHDIGRDISQAFSQARIDTDAVTRSTDNIRRHELDLVKARQQVLEQQAKISAAENELIELRKAEEPDTEAITAAELRLARAQAEVAVATDRVSTATRRLDEDHRQHAVLLRGSTEQTTELVRAEEGHTRSMGDVRRELGRLIPSLGGASSAGSLFTGVLRGMTLASAAGFAELAVLAGAHGLGGLAAGLATAGQAGLALPGVLAGVGVGVATLVVGFQGLGEAFKALDDPTALKEALKELAPAAGEFVLAVRDLAPEFQSLRKSVQQELFAGVAKDFTSLSKTYIPELKAGLSGVAKEINLGGDGLVRFAKEKQTISDTKALFQNAAGGAHFLADAVQPVLEALRDIGTVGSEFLPELGAGIDNAAHSFAAFIKEARASGQLKEWFNEGKEALSQLGEGLGNLASALGGVFRAGQGSGGSFLDSFVKITDTIDTWVNSFQGQKTLSSFFQAMGQAVTAVLPVVQALAEVFGQQVAPILADIATAVGPSFVVLVQAIGEALKVARPGIQALAEGFGDFLEGIAPALPAIGNLAKVLGETLGGVLADLGPVLGDVLGKLADTLAKIIGDPEFQQALQDLIRAFGDLVVAVIPLLPPLAEIAVAFLPVLAHLIEALVPLMGPLVTVLELLVGPLTVLATLIDTIVTGFDVLVEAVQFFTEQGAELFGGMRTSFEGETDLMKLAFGTTADSIHTSSWRIVDILRETTDAAGVAGDGIAGTAGGIGSAFFSAQVTVENAVGGMLAAVQKARAPLGGAGSALGAAFAGGVTGGANKATSGLISIINGLYAQLAGGRGRWGQAGSSLGLAFASGLAGSAVMNAIRASANKVMAAAGAFLPSSPAKEGPFSGRGWTFYRGQALMIGFVDGIYDSIPALRIAARTAVASLTLPTGGDLLASHPELFRPSGSAATGRGAPVLGPRDVANAVTDGMLAAAGQLTVTVSASQVASAVNQQNKSDAGRRL